MEENTTCSSACQETDSVKVALMCPPEIRRPLYVAVCLNGMTPERRGSASWHSEGRANCESTPRPPCCVHVILEIPEIENNTARLSFHSQPPGRKGNTRLPITCDERSYFCLRCNIMNNDHNGTVTFGFFYNGDTAVFFVQPKRTRFAPDKLACRRFQSTKRF